MIRPVHGFVILLVALATATPMVAQQASPQARPPNAKLMERVRNATPPEQQSFPLYGTNAIPNAKPTADEEAVGRMGSKVKISRPTLEVFLPAKSKSTGAGIVIFPGGGYVGLSWVLEGPAIAQFFQDHGIAAFLVKYRLPSDQTMVDKSIGPIQDAEQAMLTVRERSGEWGVDPERIGIIGFSAGGHLASTLATHFSTAYVPNPKAINLRPDFVVLIYPVISMDKTIAHMGSRNALLGPDPTDDTVRTFSNELQVTEKTPPTLILHAADDMVVDVDNSIRFFEALRHANVDVEMTIFDQGEHGFILIPKDRWQAPVMNWIESHGWLIRKNGR